MSADTLNRFAITAHDGKIISVLLQQKWTPEEARSLAAWLVVGLSLNGGDTLQELEQIAALVQAIQGA